MEKDYLPIATAHTDLVVCDRLDTLDALGTHRLAKYEHSVLNLIRTEVSRGASHKHEFFVWL